MPRLHKRARQRVSAAAEQIGASSVFFGKAA
jgi:hypothetical protein